jgi:hypothetical protein
MTEDTLVALLTQMLKPTLRGLPAARSDRDRDAQAAAVAEAAWSALVLLLRQSLATGEPAALEDIGHFERTAREIRFVPAAALLDAASLADAPADAHAWKVERAVLYLREGVALLQTVPPEARRLVATRDAPTPEEKLLQAIFGHRGTESELADQLTRLARGLSVMAGRLASPASRPDAARAERPDASPAAPRASRRRQRRYDRPPEGLERFEGEPRPETIGEAGPTSATTEP